MARRAIGGRRLCDVGRASDEVWEMVSTGEDRGGRRMSSSFVSRNDTESGRRTGGATTSLIGNLGRGIDVGRMDIMVVARQMSEEGASPSSPLSGPPGSPSRSLALLLYNLAKTFPLPLRREETFIPIPISPTRARPANKHTYRELPAPAKLDASPHCRPHWPHHLPSAFPCPSTDPTRP